MDDLDSRSSLFNCDLDVVSWLEKEGFPDFVVQSFEGTFDG